SLAKSKANPDRQTLARGVQEYRPTDPVPGSPMETASYVALSSQMALTRQLDIVANNLANASTPAFKAERVLFAEFVTQAGGPSSVQDFGTPRDTKQGALSRTGNPLDVALQGSGYFALQTPLGVRYTRNGRFQLDPNGQVVNAQGYALLDGTSPLTLPTD